MYVTSKKRVFIELLVVALLTGCSATFVPRPLNEAGFFPTKKKIPPTAVRLVSPFSDKYKNLVYIASGSWHYPTTHYLPYHPYSFWPYKTLADDFGAMPYEDFFIAMIKKMGVFANVAKKSDLELLVIKRNISNTVTNLSELDSLNRLQQEIGPFLILDSHIESRTSFEYFAEIKATDPQTGELILLLQNNVYSSSDEELIFPLLNALLQWIRGEEISTAKALYDAN